MLSELVMTITSVITYLVIGIGVVAFPIKAYWETYKEVDSMSIAVMTFFLAMFWPIVALYIGISEIRNLSRK